eukprot:5874410-Prymnesium_polylepis.1
MWRAVDYLVGKSRTRGLVCGDWVVESGNLLTRCVAEVRWPEETLCFGRRAEQHKSQRVPAEA